MIDQQPAVEITERALTYPEQAKALRITSDETFKAAGEFLVGVKALRREIDDVLGPVVQKAHAAHKAATTAKNRAEAPLVEAERIVKAEVARYSQEKERERRELEARLAREAKEAEEAARLEEAIALEEAGETELAEHVVSTPVIVPPPVLAPMTPKVEGLSTRKRWAFRITDEAKIPRTYLVVDEKKIGQVVRALGPQANIPGVDVYPDNVVAVGGAR